MLGLRQLSEAELGKNALDVPGGRCCRAERSGRLLALPPANASECPQGRGYADGQGCI